VAAVDRRRELLIVQQVSGPLLADLGMLGQVLDDNRGGFRTGHEASPRPVDAGTPEDEREDSEWDQTSAAALGQDKARADADRLDACLERARKALVEADDIRLAWLRPAKAMPTQASSTDPGCGCCAQVGTWSPTHREQTDVGGNLDRLHRLCSWCYTFVRHHGRLPNKGELNTHHQGRRVRVRG
jgi:hypothetical protein